MTWFVAALGAVIVLVGLVGLGQPGRFRAMFEAMDSQTRFVLGVGIRLVMGALLLWVADELRHPQVMRILGVVAIAAALGILVAGRARLDRLVDWWLRLDDGLLRLSAAFAAAFGAFLVYVAT